jgi:hypothetical protein
MSSHDPNGFDALERFPMPHVDELFAEPVVLCMSPADDKMPGGADSARNDQRTVVKAPGGRDAARGLDAG